MQSLRRIPTQGYFLDEVGTTSSGQYAHSLGGKNNVRGAISPNSGDRLLALLTLDLSDPRIGLQHVGLRHLHCFYSWTCAIHSGFFFYQESSVGIEVLRYAEGTEERDFPYESYPRFFPARRVDLRALTSGEQQTIELINSRSDGSFDVAEKNRHLDTPHHQIGGIPRAMQWPLDQLVCPRCSTEMSFLAAIADRIGKSRITGNAYVQTVFFLCPDCVVVGACNLCD